MPLRRKSALQQTLDLDGAIAGVAISVIGRALGSPELRAAIFGEIRAIVREEIAHAPFSDRLMGAAEAAERMGLTEAALRKAASRGTVPSHRVGRRLRFRLSELLGGADDKQVRTVDVSAVS